MRPPLALGLALGGPADARGWARACALAAWADRVGLDSLWLPEGHLRRGAPASPLLGLAAFAMHTGRIRLATTSLLLSIHDPLRVAAEVAALDQLSGGRVVLGLGRGFEPAMLRAFGVEPRTKRDRFEDALDTILHAWRDAGDGAPRPLQRPHPPLFVAAFGPKGLAQAARRGLPYLASPLESLAALERNYARHTELLPPGAPVPPVAVMRTVHVAADGAEARRVREAADAEFAALAARSTGVLAGAASGSAAERTIVGEAAEVADTIARYRERLGVDLLVVRGAARSDERERRASLERLAGDVLPRL
ncbi:MAG: LLM class flavin-dependent oxidoreductase [Deltaproteobacteria bacterium]|nr:LLM class flavin-dependent oxidoreductase [Deltaproteobacteria bacterium]